MERNVVVAKILSTHGVKGFVKLESYMEKPKDVFNYSDKLYDKNNKNVKIKFIGTSRPNVFITEIDGVNDMDLAKSYKNTELYLDSKLLPKIKDDEFYFNDLVGLKAKSIDKKSNGEIISVDDFGAGVVIEIKWDDEKNTESLPFIDDYFKEINTKNGFVIIDRPEYI
ncbi:MAG: ribosome maturation factor RimM [Rickettsiales bacterium]|nr:ribosome maturation factor RimM [Rickettsiales bacterium]